VTNVVSNSSSNVSRYTFDTTFRDVNGVTYSRLYCYKDIMASTINFTGMFQPYQTGGNLENRQVYLPVLNRNYLTRSSAYDADINEFIIVLNETIATRVMDRFFINPSNYSLRQDHPFFYVANIAEGNTATLVQFYPPGGSSSMLIYSAVPIDVTQEYYLIGSDASGVENIAPVFGVVAISEFFYIVQIKDLAFFNNPNVSPWAWLCAFNPNALYTLQFFPAALNQVEYYTVTLQNLIIPNRDIRQGTIPGARNLGDFRYIWLELYNADDNDQPDLEYINNTFSNNPNKNNRVLFQIPVTSVGGGGNYSFFASGQTPRIKFNPGYYNLRLRLLDPKGRLIIFDSTPVAAITSDSVFNGGVVDASLMNMTVELALTKYNKYG